LPMLNSFSLVNTGLRVERGAESKWASCDL
jgi:hypothetical protein